MAETKDNYGCILHTKCGGLVAPNMGVLTGEEILDMVKEGHAICFKCGEDVKPDEMEIEKEPCN